MARIRLCVSFAGQLEQHDSPSIGMVIEVSDHLAEALCSDGRAVPDGVPETATGSPGPERAVRPNAKRRG
jgi:hypothetical protein